MAVIQSLVELKTCLYAHLRLFFTNISTFITESTLLCLFFFVTIFVYIVYTRSSLKQFKHYLARQKPFNMQIIFANSSQFIFIIHMQGFAPIHQSHVVSLCYQFYRNNSFSYIKCLKLYDVISLCTTNKQTNKHESVWSGKKGFIIERHFRSTR